MKALEIIGNDLAKRLELGLRLSRGFLRANQASEKAISRQAAPVGLTRGTRASGGEIGADAFAIGREALRDL
jgi:hypothetical protein